MKNYDEIRKQNKAISIKGLEKAIHDILFESDFIKEIPTPIGTKTIITNSVTFICPSQIQEDINKEIINSPHSHKLFSNCLNNQENL